MHKFFSVLLGICFLLSGSTGRSDNFSAAGKDEKFFWQCQVKGDEKNGFKAAVSCRIAPGCYLYKQNTLISAKISNRLIGQTQPPVKITGPDRPDIYAVGTVEWKFDFPGDLQQITSDFQGCIISKDGDICLMPQQLVLWRKTPADSTAGTAAPDTASQLPENLAQALDNFVLTAKASGLLDEKALSEFLQNSQITEARPELPISDKGFWAILLLVVLGGLALNLTPCILPMIPINLAIIGAGGDNRGCAGLRRGAAYGLGITLAYGTLGVVAALSGSGFGSLNSSSIFNWIVAAVFLVLGLGMLGVYELDLSRLSNLFRGKGPRKQLWPEITALGMGMMAALLAGACVAPVVISVVVLAAKLYSEGLYWGLFLPFVLGLSMALPWPLLGAGLSVLPKPGAWMKHVKNIFGVLILLMALYYGYLGWTLRSGAFDQSKALSDLAVELDNSADGSTVLLDCWASWCKNCHALEKVLAAENIQNILKSNNIKVIRFQAEKLTDPAVKAFMEKYSLPGLPSLLLLKKGQ